MSGERYRVLRELGVGGMGVVELVHDSVRGEDVARKRILDASPAALLRFKREFRAIEALRHPNVVALYELGEDEVGPYFTMEHVEGVAFFTYCAPGTFTRAALTHTEAHPTEPMASSDPRSSPTSLPSSLGPMSGAAVSGRVRCEWDRVEHTVPQIARALSFLHARGIVHCDLKPSNVLVRADGVVKVLDFGVVAEMRAPRGRIEQVAGTLDYMAPERMRGERAAPAVDAYALGVMLFEVITGHRPFLGSSAQVLNAHLYKEPPRLVEVAVGVPEVWSSMCEALLRKAPDQRKTIAEVAKDLGATIAEESTASSLVGREALERWLLDRWREVRGGRFDYVLLTGPTGAGKSALADWLVNEAGRSGAIELRGRARPTESIGFNALDGAIDDLARVLGAERKDSTRVACAIAAESFPVLATSGPRTVARRSRREVFSAVAALLRELASRDPVVVFLDDVQWADADSLALLDALFEEAPPRVMFVVTARFDEAPGIAAAWLRARANGHELPVPPLRPSEVAVVIERAAGGGMRALRDSLIANLVAAADGLPALAEVAGRLVARGDAAIGTLPDALRALVRALPPVERDALAVVVAYDDRLSVSALAAMLDAKRGAIDEVVFSLERNALVTRTSAAGDWHVDTYHDLVRVAALSVLAPDELTRAHARIVAWLRATPDVPVYRLVRHLAASGSAWEAGDLARTAAHLAEEQRAYGFAAEMYATALVTAAVGERPALLRSRGCALERIGAYSEATSCWRELTTASIDREERLDAAIHEAECLLGSSEVVAGYDRLHAALLAMGRPSIRERSYLELARFAIGPIGTPTPSASPPSLDASQGEREIALAQLVSYFDPLAGVTLLSRARRRFASLGADDATASCEMMSALMAYFGSASDAPVRLAERYRASARARFVGKAMPPEIEAHDRYVDGLAAMKRGDWANAETSLEASITTLEDAGTTGTLPHMFALLTRSELEAWRQDFFAFAAQNRRLRAASHDAGRGPVAYQVEAGVAIERLCAGDLDAATAALGELDARWPKEPITIQRALLEGVRTWAAMLRRDARASWDASVRLLAAMRAIGGEAMYSPNWHGLIARSQLLALSAGMDEANARSITKHVRRQLAGPALFRTVGFRTLAYLAEHRKRPEEAVALLERAERDASALGQRLDAAVAKVQRGRLVGGDQGEQLRADGRRLLDATGAGECWLEEWPV